MSKSKTLQDKVDRLEKVNASLEKKETVPLRQERDELMVEIQQIVQAHREDAGPGRQDANRGLLTHEAIAERESDGPAPRSVQAGVN